MAPTAAPSIPSKVQHELNTVLGQTCCRQYVENDRSLFLGFGEIVLVGNPKGTAPHGMWEIGTYRSAWRMIENHNIICGSKELVDSVDELRQHFARLDGAKCSGLRMLSEFDVRVEFRSGVCVDFLGTFGDDDEVLHVFLPQGRVVSLSIQGGWLVQDDNPKS